MALTLEQVRNTIITSIFGRRLGLDINQQLVGVNGLRHPINAATSDTTATAISASGFWTVDTTTDDGWTGSAPIVGGRLEIMTVSTSTGIRTITMPSGTLIQSSANSTGSIITCQGGGQTLGLIGLTTALYGILYKGANSLASSAVSTNMAIT